MAIVRAHRIVHVALVRTAVQGASNSAVNRSIAAMRGFASSEIYCPTRLLHAFFTSAEARVDLRRSLVVQKRTCRDGSRRRPCVGASAYFLGRSAKLSGGNCVEACQ